MMTERCYNINTFCYSSKKQRDKFKAFLPFIMIMVFKLLRIACCFLYIFSHLYFLDGLIIFLFEVCSESPMLK